MKHKLHGISSLVLFVMAAAVALINVWVYSPWLGLLYIAICGFCSYGILLAYCAKCIARLDNCSHVFPGRITRLLPKRKQGPYSFGDIAGTALFLGVIVLFPQYWLLGNTAALALFWVLVVTAVAEIFAFVCPRCENRQCLMCPKP